MAQKENRPPQLSGEQPLEAHATGDLLDKASRIVGSTATTRNIIIYTEDSKVMQIEFTKAQASVLFDAAVQMQDDAVEIYGNSRASALTRALEILATATQD